MNNSEMKNNGITHVFEEDLEDTSCLFINEAGNTFHTTTTSETTNSGFGYT
jgi:hypothetical protein